MPLAFWLARAVSRGSKSCLRLVILITAGGSMAVASLLASTETTNATRAFEVRLAHYQASLQQDPTNTALLFEIADFCFDHGAQENPRAVVLAENYFRRLLDLNPSNSLARVMLGSTLTMRGRDAFWPTAKLRHAREGLREMDAAVAQEPQNPRVRFERAVNNVHMPKLMQREEIVKSDLEWLWSLANSESSSLTPSLRQNVALYYGVFLKKSHRSEEAERIWRRGLEWAPSSEVGHKIRKNLKGPFSAEERIPPSLHR